MANSMFKKNVNRSIGGNIGVFLVLVVFALFMIVPLIYQVGNSFKTLDQIYIFPPVIIPKRLTFDNYIMINLITSFNWIPFSRYLFNSFFITIVSTVGNLLLASMAAYPLAKHEFKGKNLFRAAIVIALLFNSAVTYIPSYVIMSSMHIVNTYWCLILPFFQSALGLYLMQNFMAQINDSMLEAARIDGASEYKIYWKIVMPNVKPAWLTLIIFNFQSVWGSQGTTSFGTLSGSMIYNESLKTLPALFSQIALSGTARAGVAAAAAVIIMLPPMIIFLFSQNYVIETMSTSGLK
jgi:putative chitobiose transport system permease protein